MTLILCIDDAGGISFFGKRQSQDRVLRQRILEMAKSKPFLVTPYTAKQFSDASFSGVSNPSSHFQKGAIYFAEDGFVPTTGLKKIVLYRWNRRYPADRFFDLTKYQTRLISKSDFAGSSHEKITEEIYEVLP